MPILVSKAQVPDHEALNKRFARLLETAWFTNRGEMVRELEERLAEYLGVHHVVAVSSGTVGIQALIKALGLCGNVVTTPFTFIATASAVKWEGLEVAFADIDSKAWNLDANRVAERVDDDTAAIMPVHVFGNPCRVDDFQQLAVSRELPIIYDAAHAFGVRRNGNSILNAGNASVLSFHATKLFHTVEGGAVITNDESLAADVRKRINFGITGPESIECVGINGKMSEFHAAMGLCLLPEMDRHIAKREMLAEIYRTELSELVEFQQWSEGATNNYGYQPVLLRSESEVKRVQEALGKEQIVPRRYFYPSLDSLDFLQATDICPVSRDVASRILCLPMYPDLDEKDCRMIGRLMVDAIDSAR